MRRPILRITYNDPGGAVTGYLVIDRLVNGLSAGGLRVHPDVTEAGIAQLAGKMTDKQAAAGIQVGGAKAGLAMNPDHHDRSAILSRFLEAMRPFLLSSLSLGPDMNTSLLELERLGRALGIPCLKIAVGRTRGLSDEMFLARYALFEERTRLGTVNQLRAAQGAATATMALLDRLEVVPSRARIVIQGAGTMGAGIARLLSSEGIPIVAWSDAEKSLLNKGGLDVPRLHERRNGGLLPHDPRSAAPETVLTLPCDILILAAVSNAIEPEMLSSLNCRGIVEAANLALSRDVEDRLHAAGVLVVPDLLASVGGSLAVEALYAGAPTTGEEILQHVALRTRTLVEGVLRRSLLEGAAPSRIAASGTMD